jgi:amidohydrolase
VLSGVDARRAVGAAFDEMVDTQRALHAHPELSFAELETTALIRSRASALGLTDWARPTETGGVFMLEGSRPGHTVVLRADIDALPVHEHADARHRSLVDGVMHACGHDFHTAAMLGVARVLSERAADLPGRYLFVFQPGEEALDGARAMLEGGALAGLGPARLVGCHVASMLPVGMVGLRPGTSMSEVHSLRITLRGSGGHGAIPTTDGDVVQAVARIVGALAGTVAGLDYEGTKCVCSAGVLQAGTAPNVVPDRAVLQGTLRTFTGAQREAALENLQVLCAGIAADFGVSVDLAIPGHTRAVVNDPAMTALVHAAAAEVLSPDQVVTLPPLAPSDDVSEFLAIVPGCYFFVGGARKDGTSGMHHCPTFAVDERALDTAASVLINSALSMAAPA